MYNDKRENVVAATIVIQITEYRLLKAALKLCDSMHGNFRTLASGL